MSSDRASESEANKAPQTRHVESSQVNDEPHQIQDADGTRTKVVYADGAIDYVDDRAMGGELNGMPKGYYTSPQFIGTVAAQCFASICAYLGWVLPANTLPLINADIGNSTQINWAATIWTMGTSIGFLLVGRLSDLYGRKWMVLSTTVLGLIGCILGGTARNVAMLIVGNGCNGLAAAGQLSFGIVLGELVPNKQRGPIVTLVFLSSLPFAVFGPVIARSLIENTSEGWRWSFYIGIILNFITLVLYQFLYHPPTFEQLHVGKTRLQQTKELDWIGIFLYISGCVLFLIGLSWGGSTYPWASAEVLCPLIIGIATVAAFFVYEGYFCRVQPLMPPRMFRNIGFDAIIAIATIGSMVYYSFTVLWPTLISSVYTTDSMEIGWQSSVVGGGVLLGQVMAGFAISYVPKVKIQCIIAGCTILAFVTAQTALSPDTWARTIAFGVISCTAVGYVENISYPGVTLLWEPQDIGLATGVLGSIRGLGGAVAQALYLSIYTNKIVETMPKEVSARALGAGLPEDSLPALFDGIAAGDFSAVPGMSDTIAAAVARALKVANADAFRIVFYSTIPFSVIVLVSACLVPNFEKFLTKNVARKLQNKRFETDVAEKKVAEA
ncbi:putative MFS-type transporter -like protein [Hapsidospora chrysogenum ATCC 11550]|uniref:Putative MFS-type transporter-like protein n=1 Tax=Hapsidospora chrysogenum (strain ATCC 11550 / CBS 779.69 / DSM 880 / IAM 14645 / JCM 23072 / IMI 49137) TaxID=857340 RepID=A0A086TAX3_HAPC1|nr:putative MFS-type transporter -like protein [Hapsidospora chrysogenum ATCC 11550]